MTHNIKFILAWSVFFFHLFQSIIIFLCFFFTDHHNRAIIVAPFMPFKCIGKKLLYHHCRWIFSAFYTYIIFFTAFKSTAYIIGWAAKYYNHIIAQFCRTFKRILYQFFSVPLSLIFWFDAERAKGQNLLFVSILVQ